jgi:hypothetical protein
VTNEDILAFSLLCNGKNISKGMGHEKGYTYISDNKRAVAEIML